MEYTKTTLVKPGSIIAAAVISKVVIKVKTNKKYITRNQIQ